MAEKTEDPTPVEDDEVFQLIEDVALPEFYRYDGPEALDFIVTNYPAHLQAGSTSIELNCQGNLYAVSMGQWIHRDPITGSFSVSNTGPVEDD